MPAAACRSWRMRSALDWIARDCSQIGGGGRSGAPRSATVVRRPGAPTGSWRSWAVAFADRAAACRPADTVAPRPASPLPAPEPAPVRPRARAAVPLVAGGSAAAIPDSDARAGAGEAAARVCCIRRLGAHRRGRLECLPRVAVPEQSSQPAIVPAARRRSPLASRGWASACCRVDPHRCIGVDRRESPSPNQSGACGLRSMSCRTSRTSNRQAADNASIGSRRRQRSRGGFRVQRPGMHGELRTAAVERSGTGSRRNASS